MTERAIGIDVGSINLKVCLLDPERGERHAVAAHEGNVTEALAGLFLHLELDDSGDAIKGVVTGTEGRHRIELPEVITPVAVEAGLRALDLQPRAVVSLGGEDMVVFGLDARGQIASTYAGNKCASGTGEFLRQQLGRMDLEIGDLDRVAEGATACRLSARCSVFMKSDCTHRLNKGESTKGDIALSLSKVMADKAGEFLIKAKINSGQVVLVGGVTQNRFLVQYLREAWPKVDFVVPEQAPFFEAFGAARLAQDDVAGATLPALSTLMHAGRGVTYDRLESLPGARDLVHYHDSMRAAFDPDAEYVLGVDGGSTTTKVALINRATLEIVAEHYGRTHGDPVASLKECLRQVRAQLGDGQPRITLAAATGSSRELLGVFLETAGVYNEIIAHTVGTTYFEKDVDTIFEIGGQDAKYVLINNGVPIDYAMNEACSAGTGSFLEESAQGDLDIGSAPEIAPIALEATAPLKFGEHCSAFINSDIRKAIQQGATREDVVAGLVYSIVANYLNRVVGNRSVGEHVVLQGGVAKNEAVPLAFARMTGKQVVVPPDPELMGCFGVARLALQKHDEGLLTAGGFNLDALIDKEIVYRSSFTCKSCDNLCEIRRLEVGGKRYPFGGRCSLYTNKRKKRRVAKDATDYSELRTRMLFEEFAPNPSTLVPRSPKVVGIPLAFSVHSVWPIYAWFFHSLGVRTLLSDKIVAEGIAKQESNYCFPAEIAHGAVQDVIDQGVDYLFLPQFRDMPSHEAGNVHACLCPLTQGLPFFSRHAFGLDDSQVLRPLVTFKHGWDSCQHEFEDVARKLGFTKQEGAAAFNKGLREYQHFLEAYAEAGRELLREIQDNPDRIYVALLGRPYNAFTRDANMGIPRKITSQGVSVVPYDMIYQPDDEIFPNMYWYYGQQDMKAVRQVKKVDNLYLTWVSNFSCAPDSFMLHYVRWMMGQKPYLVLEIDSHTADAGLDTRVEAFLDIVESYRRHVDPKAEQKFMRRYRVELKKEFCDIVDNVTGERVDIRDPCITLVRPSMGDLGVEAAAAASAHQGMRAEHLPVPDVRSTQLARQVASGKECIPALLVLGSILQFFKDRELNKAGEIYVVFVPSTLGPCRTGQYHVFYDHLFEELGWENVVLMVGESENSYRELGPSMNKDVWRSVVVSDYFTDVRTGIKLLARDPEAGQRVFDRVWQEVLVALEKGPHALDKAMRRAGEAFASIPKKRTLDEVKKVLVVGEIYVRRDNFSVEEISDFLIDKGIFPKVAGVTEWIYYTDYARKYLFKEQHNRDGLLKMARDGGLAELGVYYIEAGWKHAVEERIRRHLDPAGLIPTVPHDMDRVLEEGRKIFIEPALESEATISPAVGAAAMQDGYSGVAIIAPFACLPGRLIEGVYAPWAKAKGYPVIALENDGQPYPPSIVSRMELFAHNVLRFDT